MKTIVTSFYSDIGGHDYYTRSTDRLRSCLDALGITHDIRQLPSLGSYRANCLAKPGFILDQLDRTQNPIVWLDVDSIVYRPLDVFDEFARSRIDVGVATMTGDVEGLQSTPLFLGNTAGARSFLSAWKEAAARLMATERTQFDHEALFWIFPKFASELNIRWLGPEYCAWPGRRDARTVIELGLSDDPGKADVLREMGHSEALIALETPGFLPADEEAEAGP
jgi:hypothetical protein